MHTRSAVTVSAVPVLHIRAPAVGRDSELFLPASVSCDSPPIFSPFQLLGAFVQAQETFRPYTKPCKKGVVVPVLN
jgi:hypothetical protein